MIKIYHNKRCRISRKVLDALNEYFPNDEIHVHDYLSMPLSFEELKSLFSKLKMPALDVIRKKEKLFIENYKGKTYSDDEWIRIIEKNPILLERPIVIKDNKAILCRPPERIQELTQP